MNRQNFIKLLDSGHDKVTLINFDSDESNLPYGFYNHYTRAIVINCSKCSKFYQKAFTVFHEKLHKLTDFKNPILTFIMAYLIDSTNDISLSLLFKAKLGFKIPTFTEYFNA